MRAGCEILDVSRSGLYAWRDETETQRERENRGLVPLVCEVFYGAGLSESGSKPAEFRELSNR